MAQDEVYKILKANQGQWFSAKRISQLTGVNTSSIQVSLRKLYDFGMLERERTKGFVGYHYRLPIKRLPKVKAEFGHKVK